MKVAMKVDRIDHIVLTVRNVEVTTAFYASVLGMEVRRFDGGRVALHFGDQKIHLHPQPSPIEPKAVAPTPGSGDFCFITAAPIDDVVRHLEACGIAIEDGPVARTEAQGPMTSVYFRDPDGNLVEIARY